MLNSDCFDGTISIDEFRTAASAFIEIWRDCSSSALPMWSWVSPPKQPWLRDHVDGYLVLEKLCLTRPHKEGDSTRGTAVEEPSCATAAGDNGDDNGDLVIDNATLVESTDQETHHYYDFHMVYSSSYRVPVLYFRIYAADGQPLALGEFERDLPVGSADELLKSKWTFITQEEHPYLNRPWYKLHPCGTSEWLRLLFHSDASVQTREAAIELYLVSWFSFVGQVFGLGISSEMMKNRKQP